MRYGGRGSAWWLLFFFKQKTAYELIWCWSSDVCSSDLGRHGLAARRNFLAARRRRLKSFDAQQIHAVLGARLRFHNQPGRSARRHDGASLARHNPRIRTLRLNHDRREVRSEEHTSELQSPDHLVCRLLLEKKKQKRDTADNSSSYSIRVGATSRRVFLHVNDTNSHYILLATYHILFRSTASYLMSPVPMC